MWAEYTRAAPLQYCNKSRKNVASVGYKKGNTSRTNPGGKTESGVGARQANPLSNGIIAWHRISLRSLVDYAEAGDIFENII
jgi:hypothetical protein